MIDSIILIVVRYLILFFFIISMFIGLAKNEEVKRYKYMKASLISFFILSFFTIVDIVPNVSTKNETFKYENDIILFFAAISVIIIWYLSLAGIAYLYNKKENKKTEDLMYTYKYSLDDAKEIINEYQKRFGMLENEHKED